MIVSASNGATGAGTRHLIRFVERVDRGRSCGDGRCPEGRVVENFQCPPPRPSQKTGRA